ncbi:MAG TPA: hypothetical protein VF062_11235 [Candidatus Limnocylindrales bacterium]
MSESVAERYLRLGLRVGRHDDGVIDAYFGPPELKAAIDAEPPADPRELVADAEALLAELDDGWMRDQVLGVHMFTRVLAGESVSYADEVHGLYGIRPVHTDEAVFAAAHEQLADLLPGTGTLAERHDRWRDSMLVPADRIEATVAAVIEEARTQTRRLVDLPDGEGIDLEMVTAVPWLGYNSYLGGLRGRVEINASMPMTAMDLLLVAIHETYPGHQAERACHEQLLVRERGMLEETLVLSFTQQSVVSEGIGNLAPRLLLEGDGGPALAATVHDTAGVEFDLALALAIDRAGDPCRWSEANAALMLHSSGAGEDEVKEYVRRWDLADPAMAEHVIRYVTEPSSRTYIFNYLTGAALCDAFIAGDPQRFRRLLGEQIRVADLLTTARLEPPPPSS